MRVFHPGGCLFVSETGFLCAALAVLELMDPPATLPLTQPLEPVYAVLGGEKIPVDVIKYLGWSHP